MKPRRVAVIVFGVLALLGATIAFNNGWLALGGAPRPPVGRVRPADLAPALREGATVPTVTTPTSDHGHDDGHDGGLGGGHDVDRDVDQDGDDD